MDAIIGFAFFVVLILVGLFVGGARERKHLADLTLREQHCSDMLQTQTKGYLAAEASDMPPQMYVAEVVIATDYLKTFLAGLRKFFGGEIRSYQTLLVRARREATLRILEQARQQGYNAICNLRLENADIGGNNNAKGVAMVAILASATAYRASIR